MATSTIRLHRVLRAAPERVYRAFLDPDAIAIRPFDDELGYLVLMAVSSDPFVATTAQSMREGSKMPRADWTFDRTTLS